MSQGALADAGLAFLHQDAPVAPAMTVMENIRVGRYRQRSVRRGSPAAERRRVRTLLESMQVDARPDDLAGDLPTADCALVGFAAAVDALSSARVCSSSTSPPRAFRRAPPAPVRRHRPRDRGQIRRAVLVSHRLDEVLAVSQRISVLRDGRLVATLDREDADEQRSMRLMLGRDLDEIYPKRSTDDERRPVVDVERMSGRLVEDVSLHVRGRRDRRRHGPRGHGPGRASLSRLRSAAQCGRRCAPERRGRPPADARSCGGGASPSSPRIDRAPRVR